MFGRKKSANKACKNSNVEAQKESTSACKGCSTSSKQQSKSKSCDKKSGSSRCCK